MDTKNQGYVAVYLAREQWTMDNAIDIKQEDGTVVGHVPREFSNTFYFYIKRGGQVM